MTISLRHILIFLLVGIVVAFNCYLESQLNATRAKLSDAWDELATANQDLENAREAARLTGEMLDARNQVDHERTEALNDALTENKALQRAVADRDKRLLVRAACNVPRSADPGAAGLADAGTAELAADARSDYFTLRDQLALANEMILGLQDYILRVVFHAPAQP
ncbi:prophage PSPPH06, lysis protein [Pseudomonas sp. StFLB209]|uniref:lysis system i-spanin subunit Rz n=1 Tax=Pseudomonas sp. StFLB209 TaxID=1028989 RepID=UPI0004F6B7F4|nr:lysis system i-spanin subunit Rz [Pseudomonas sp. StFLB209]BAP41296.1 prophage PSPPH06, lysis protein [Pseudomonas sp. StFLB209]